MDECLILLHCALVDGFGPANLAKVLNFLKLHKSSSFDYIYSMSEEEFVQSGLSRDLSKKLKAGLANQESLEKELELIQKFNIRFITIADPKVSSRFKRHSFASFCFICKGRNA